MSFSLRAAVPRTPIHSPAAGIPAGSSLVRFVLAGILVVVACQVAVMVSNLAQPVPAAYVFSDDAFYDFTVARNVATGHGITIDGTRATSGFQPLWTALLVPCYRIARSDRAFFGLAYLLSILCWGVVCWLFVRLVAEHLPAGPYRPVVLGLAVLCFVADHDIQGYVSSGLETGLYAALLLVCLRLWPRGAPARVSPWGLGLLLGALMLARNDGVFFAGAFLFSILAWQRHRAGLAAALAAGLVASALLLPWLVFGHSHCGSIVPQGARATGIGVNAVPLSLAKIVGTLETLASLFLALGAPLARLGHAAYAVLGTLAVGLLATLAVREARRRRELAALALPYLGACALLVGYYLLASGAVWFYPRYFMPIKLVALFLLILAFAHVLRRAPALVRGGLIAAVVLACVGLGLHRVQSTFGRGGYMTNEALSLLRAHVGTGRIGMFESGRAGYLFPERVVNLDGKVNLDVLEATAAGKFLEYLDRDHVDALYCRPECLRWLKDDFRTLGGTYRDEGTLDGLTPEHLYRREARTVAGGRGAVPTSLATGGASPG
jgi:hypothetical protein